MSQLSSLNRVTSDTSSFEPSLPSISLDESISSQRAVQFDAGANHLRDPAVVDEPAAVGKQRKLRKVKQDGGYESDTGYVSDAVSKKEKKKSKTKGDGHATGEESDGGYLSEVLARRRRKKKEKKERELAGATDDEPDGGNLSSLSKKERKSKKAPTTGDESDGGNLSEASTKRKLFGFRLKARRKDSADGSHKNVIPPVPSLPAVSLPIAERFGLSLTDLSSTRASTPALSVRTSTQRSSDETFATEISIQEVPAVLVPPPLPSPNPSIQGLTSAFNDAQSVRTPSTDVLRAFGRQALAATPRSPLSPSSSASQLTVKESSAVPSSFSDPTRTIPRPTRNTSLKKVPSAINTAGNPGLSIQTHHMADSDVTMALTPPTPTPGVRPLRLVSKPASLNISVSSASPSAQSVPTTPAGSGAGKCSCNSTIRLSQVCFSDYASGNSSSQTPDSMGPSPLPSPSAAPPNAQFIIRSTTLSKYDLPPPSPPPMGPLPRVPVESPAYVSSPLPRSREGSRRPSIVGEDGRSALRVQVPVLGSPGGTRPLTAPGRVIPLSPRSPGRPGTAPSSPPPQLSSFALSPVPPARSTPSPTPGSGGGPPLFLQRIPSNQRGRESPFPTQPFITRKPSQGSFSPSGSSSTLSASPSSPQYHQPMSTGLFLEETPRPDGPPRLDINWQPRSASILDGKTTEGRESWASVEEPRTSTSTRNSSSSSQRDVDSVLSALKDNDDIMDLYLSASRRGSGEDADLDDDDTSKYPDDEADFDSRYSIFSDSQEPSRISILDKERSSNVRQQFLKRVEEMYSKEGIQRGMAPPVPKLPPSSPSWR